jgi:hypothetical protein
MTWKNVHSDEPPAHGQQVLLAVDGAYYVTHYDAVKNVYRLHEDPDSYFSPADNSVMHWVFIEEPPQEKLVIKR